MGRISQTQTAVAERCPDSALPQAWVALFHASNCLQRETEAALREKMGLSPSEGLVLASLCQAHDQQARPSQLANLTGLTRSGITRLIDGLVRKGWVERAACSEDGRVFYVRLTQEGSGKAADAHQVQDQVASERLERLSAADQHALSQMLSQLMKHPDDAIV